MSHGRIASGPGLVAARRRRHASSRVIRSRLFILAWCGIGLCVITPTARANFHYAAPHGHRDAIGTVDDPWDLQTALTQPGTVIAPGDTLWLRGGTYLGTFLCDLVGSEADPIIVRQYPGERVVIDGVDSSRYGGVLQVTARDVWFWGFEITSSDPARFTPLTGNTTANIARPVGVSIGASPGDGHGCRFINLAIHDTAEGHWFSIRAVDAEVYGNVIYNNGWIAPDRPHGHGVYVRNDTGEKQITDNIIFNQFGFGVHGWSDSGLLRRISCEGNISFNNGGLASVYFPNLYFSSGSQSCRLLENYTYHHGPAAVASAGSVIANHSDLTVAGNVFAAPGAIALRLGTCDTTRYVGGNLFFGDVEGLDADIDQDGNVQASNGSGVSVIVRPNRYEDGSGYESPRAHVAVYNWELAPTVTVDLGAALLPGDPYEIRDAMNLWGPPVASGVYEGAPVSVRMDLTSVAAPVGVGEDGTPIGTPPHTAPEFAAFVVTSPIRDLDADGVPELADVCPERHAPGGVDHEGRPLGDLTGDCTVDLEDQSIFSRCHGGSDRPPAPGCVDGAAADFDRDGDVDMVDFAILSRNFIAPSSDPCPGVAAPGGRDEFGRPLGDLNRDCTVDAEDFAMFARCFGGTGAPAAPGCADAVRTDLDDDGDVDLIDFAIFARNYSG